MAAEKTADRILDAAMRNASETGLGRLTVDTIAAAAAVSRQTVYRHFGRKDLLVKRLVLREEARVLARVRKVATEATSLELAIEYSVCALYEEARRHPLLDRLLRDEPGAILPHLVDPDAEFLRAGSSLFEEIMFRFFPDFSSHGRARLADMVARLCLSYVTSPPSAIHLVARDLASMVHAIVRSAPT